MRENHSSELDNLAEQMSSSIQSKMDISILLSTTAYQRSYEFLRDGHLDYGAFQMRNMKSNCYATFGSPSSCLNVGP